MINSPRIQKICSLVSSKIIAEIGCDHAYITKNLLDSGKVKFAYLTDISKKCLQKAKINLKNYSSNIAFYEGDGLKALNSIKEPINEIIIAGMGGREIIKILSENKSEKYSNFILQPQKNVIKLREFLQLNNYNIVSDEIVKEGKMFYFVLKVERSKKPKPLDTFSLYFGNTEDKKTLKDYLLFELEKRKTISKKKKILENEMLIRLIEQYLQCLKLI